MSLAWMRLLQLVLNLFQYRFASLAMTLSLRNDEVVTLNLKSVWQHSDKRTRQHCYYYRRQ
jgi:hypothetical protein